MVSKIPLAISIAFAVVFVVPLLLLFTTGTSLHEFLTTFSNPRNTAALWTTLYPAAVGAAIATTLGATFAWIIFRTNVPGRKFLAILPFLELALPKVVKALGFEFLLDPKVGLYNQLFMGLFHVSFPIFNINSNAGLALAGGAGGMPFAYITIIAAMRGLDSSLEDSARITGSSLWNTLRRVTIPIISPAIITAYIINFVIIAATFDYAFIFGQQASSGVNTLATAVYDSVTESFPPNYSAAAALSMYYIIITIVGITIWLWYTRRSYKFVTVAGNKSRPTIYTLQGWKRWLALVICIGLLWVSFLQLAFILGLVSLYPLFTTITTTHALYTASFINYQQLFFSKFYGLFWTAYENSLIIATVTATITAFLATFLAYSAQRSRIRGSRLLEYFNTLPYGTPGIVWSLAFLYFMLETPFIAHYLYGSIYALMIALVVVWLPYSVRIVSGPMLQISREMEEAASISGAKWRRMFRTVLIPLVKTGIMSSFVYVFMDSFRELGDVILLVTPKSYVLTVFIADLYTNTVTSYGVQAATSVVMILTMVAFLFGMNYLLKGQLLQAVGEEEKAAPLAIGIAAS
ncbi:MAG: ABC transporter permease [Nitrososphaerales archaeon]